MAAYCSFFCSSMAFTVCPPFSSAGGSTSLVLPMINVFHGLRAVLFSGGQHNAHSSTLRWVSQWFACHIAQRMAADCSHLHLSMAFTVCASYFSVDGSGLLTPSIVNGFHAGLRPVLRRRSHRITHTSASQWLSRFACRFRQRMVAHRSFFLSSLSFMVCALLCSADGNALLFLPLVDSFHDGVRAVLLSRWQ